METSGEPFLDLRELHELLLVEETLDTALQRVADLAVATVPACDCCGVTLTDNGRFFTRVATDELAHKVDEIQYRADQGPCLEAMRTGDTFRVDDTSADPRWPRFLPLAAREGVVASYSEPLKVRDNVVGAMNLYSTGTQFGDVDGRLIASFSRQAAIVLANAAAYKKTRDVVDQLNEALESRDLIGQAKGIVMAREGVDADAAFGRLRSLSQSRNRKLRDIARDIVNSVSISR